MPRWSYISDEERFWAKVKKDTCLGDICGCQKGLGHCWPWTGRKNTHKNRGGYGTFKIRLNGQWIRVLAHRYAFELQHGKILPGLHVCHACDIRYCICDDHFFLGTPKQNTQDAVQKNRLAKGENSGIRLHPERYPRGDQHPSRLHPERLPHGDDHYLRRFPEKRARLIGENNPSAKLTDEDVAMIRSLFGSMTGKAIAARFHVSPAHISAIRTGKKRLNLS